MAWEFDETEENEGLDKDFETITLLGAELPVITDFNDFPRMLKKRIVSLFKSYGNILKKLEEPFSEEAELEVEEFILRMLAVWTQHPKVKEEDTLYFEGKGGLKERWKPDKTSKDKLPPKSKLSTKFFVEVTPAVNKLTLDLYNSINKNFEALSGENPKVVKDKKKSRSTT